MPDVADSRMPCDTAGEWAGRRTSIGGKAEVEGSEEEDEGWKGRRRGEMAWRSCFSAEGEGGRVGDWARRETPRLGCLLTVLELRVLGCAVFVLEEDTDAAGVCPVGRVALHRLRTGKNRISSGLGSIGTVGLMHDEKRSIKEPGT